MVYQLNYRQRKWYYCATTHRKQACPAYGKICLKCKKLNHFQLVFRSKYKINAIDDTNSNTESYVDIYGLYIDHVESSVITKHNEIALDAAVNDFNIIFKLDIEHSVIPNINPITIFKKIKSQPKLLKTKQQSL